MNEVYVLLSSIPYEGDDLISVHATLDGAKAAASAHHYVTEDDITFDRNEWVTPPHSLGYPDRIERLANRHEYTLIIDKREVLP